MDSPQAILDSIQTRRVLVIGDTIVDVNTPVVQLNDQDDGTPVYGEATRSQITLGGAALVVRNLLELGAKVEFLTGMGYGPGRLPLSQFRHPQLAALHLVQLSTLQPVKTRLWCAGRKLLQLDQVENRPVPPDVEEQLHEMLDTLLREPFDVVVVADYRHGLLSDGMAAHLVEGRSGQPLIVSSQVSQRESNHDWYVGATVVVLNRAEAQAVLPQMDEYDADYVEALRDKLKASTVIITCGAEGCLSADELVGGGRTLPLVDIACVDPCGAGDAFLAAYAVTGLLSFANLWAGLSCTLPGPNPPTKEMLKPYASGIERDVLGSHRDGARAPRGDEADHHAQGIAKFARSSHQEM